MFIHPRIPLGGPPIIADRRGLAGAHQRQSNAYHISGVSLHQSLHRQGGQAARQSLKARKKKKGPSLLSLSSHPLTIYLFSPKSFILLSPIWITIPFFVSIRLSRMSFIVRMSSSWFMVSSFFFQKPKTRPTLVLSFIWRARLNLKTNDSLWLVKNVCSVISYSLPTTHEAQEEFGGKSVRRMYL